MSNKPNLKSLNLESNGNGLLAANHDESYSPGMQNGQSMIEIFWRFDIQFSVVIKTDVLNSSYIIMPYYTLNSEITRLFVSNVFVLIYLYIRLTSCNSISNMFYFYQTN